MELVGGGTCSFRGQGGGDLGTESPFRRPAAPWRGRGSHPPSRRSSPSQECPDLEDLHPGFDPASAPPLPEKPRGGDHGVALVDCLLDLDAEALHVSSTPPQEALDPVVAAVDVRVEDVPGEVDHDPRVEVFGYPLELPLGPELHAAANHLDVLLRHRTPSIPPRPGGHRLHARRVLTVQGATKGVVMPKTFRLTISIALAALVLGATSLLAPGASGSPVATRLQGLQPEGRVAATPHPPPELTSLKVFSYHLRQGQGRDPGLPPLPGPSTAAPTGAAPEPRAPLPLPRGHRQKVPGVQYDATVVCRRGGNKVVSTYTQNI